MAAQEVFPPTCPHKEEPSRRAGEGADGWERRAPRAGHPRPRCFGSGGRCCWGCPLASDVALLLKHLSMPRHFGRHCRNPGLIPARPPLSVPKHVGRHCCARGTAPPTCPHKEEPNRRAGEGAGGRGSFGSDTRGAGVRGIRESQLLCPEPWQPTSPSYWSISLCQLTLAVFVAVEQKPTRPPCGLAPLVGAGGWERQVSGAPHFRPKRIGTGRCCPQKRSLPRHPGQAVDRLLVSLLAAEVAPLLKHVSLPTRVGGQRCSSGGIPTHPPPKGSAKVQGGRVGETSFWSIAPAAKVR